MENPQSACFPAWLTLNKLVSGTTDKVRSTHTYILQQQYISTCALGLAIRQRSMLSSAQLRSKITAKKT
jgi:hypothetical protein